MRLAEGAMLLCICGALGAATTSGQVAGQQAGAGCAAGQQTVVGRRWDAVLGRQWEIVTDCAHPEWPVRAVEVASGRQMREPVSAMEMSGPRNGALGPLLVHEGDAVRLWQEAGNVRIEMTGVAEKAARSGDRVMVRITRQTDDAGLTVQRIAGIVRDNGAVEMER